MKYAICNETFGDAPLSEGFRMAKDIGYSGIEIAPFTLTEEPGKQLANVGDFSKSSRQKVRDLASSHDLDVVGLHWLFAKTEGFYLTSPDPIVRKDTSKYLIELAKLCRELGGHVLVLGSPQQRNLLPGVTYGAAENYATEVIESAIPALQDENVILALEPLGPAEGDFMNTAASAVRIIERVDSPNCRLHLDVKAMASESLEIVEIIRTNRDLISHFHANDPNLLGPGMGDIDFLQIAQALNEIDYQRWISVEVFRYEPTPYEIAKTSLLNLRSAFDAAARSDDS